jgi:signal transduction histidine kinase/ligand-binding sensor domain-containing protein
MVTRFVAWRAAAGLSIALTIALAPGRAVSPDQPANSYIRTTFTVEDGLSSNVVNALLQTRDGFLWIGTDAGLNRFDGRHFAPIYFRGPESTPQGIVSALAEATNGDLWIGTTAGLVRISQQGLSQFDRSLSTFYHAGAGSSDEIRCLHVGRDGTLWVGTSGGLYRFSGERFQDVIHDTIIDRIEEGLDGHLLVVTHHGFVELDGTKVIDHPGLPQQLGVIPEAIFHVFQDRQGAVWFCTSTGLARLLNGSLEKFQPYGKDGDGILHGYEDPQGNLWVEASTLTSAQQTGGIFRVSGGKRELLEASTQVRTSPISADREGNLWIGTNGQGLLRFKDRPIQMFNKADGLPNNIPMTVLSKKDGSLWVGDNCGGLSVFDGEKFKTYDEKDGLANSCVWALAEGQNGDLWVGTWGGGLFRFANGRFTQFNSQQGLADSIVRAIIAARDGSLWIATENGLSHMTDGKFHNYTTADGLSSNRVLSVYQDRRGIIWAGSSRGVNRMDGDRFVPVVSPQKNFDPRYISLAEDAAGGLYALSAPKGIDRIEGNNLAQVNHDLDLLTMISAPNGDLWFSGGNGVFRFSSAAFRGSQEGQENLPDYAWFGKADGMTSTQCSIGAPNMALTADGKLWVATVQGLAMLDLRRLSFNSGKPTVFVEDVTIGRIRQPAGRELVLPPGTHHVEFRFDSISLASPEKIRFQYRMNDVDPVWLDADSAHTAVYTNIPAGTHAFRIRASNSDGVWDRDGISFSVTQKPYFYQTAWFNLAWVAGLVILLWALYQLRLRQLAQQYNIRLEERVSERSRIARELHDTLLQSFHGVSLLFHSLSEELPEGATKQKFRRTVDLASDAIRQGRSAVQGLRATTIETNDLAASVRVLAEGLAADEAGENAPLFSVAVEGAARDLQPILRDEVFRIAAEALRNAFRHSQAGRIEVEIRYYPSRLVVKIRDDGKGIEAQMLGQGGRTGHWGLSGMRERAGEIGGKLHISSEGKSGTVVELSVPARIAYLK